MSGWKMNQCPAGAARREEGRWKSDVPFSIFQFPDVFAILKVTLLVVTVFLASPAPIFAHGGGVSQLAAEPVGPYELFAWTSPDPARAGTVHVTVALAEPATDEPVLNAGVQVQMLPLAVDGEARPVSAQATHAAAANKVTYETDLQVPAAGRWQVVIAVKTAQGDGHAAFPLDVKPAAAINWLLVGGVGAGLVAAAWLFWPARRKPEVRGQRAEVRRQRVSPIGRSRSRVFAPVRLVP